MNVLALGTSVDYVSQVGKLLHCNHKKMAKKIIWKNPTNTLNSIANGG